MSLETTKSLGTAIRNYRTKTGATITTTARTAGYTRVYLSLIENGHRSPSAKALEAIATALGTESSKLKSAATRLAKKAA